MKTTLNIPESLINKAMSLSKHKTKTETVIAALEDYVRQKTIQKIMKYQGRLKFNETWKKSRHAR